MMPTQIPRWTCCLLLLAGCGAYDRVTGNPGGGFNDDEWRALASLANPGDPPVDLSNKYSLSLDAQALGKKFFFDPRFSGNSVLTDIIRRPVEYARSPKGTPSGVSCSSCHNPGLAGTDLTSAPGHVAVGTGWFDTNSQHLSNVALHRYWNWSAKNDSLWSVVPGVIEQPVALNGTRLQSVWLVNEKYRAAFAQALPDLVMPLPAVSLAELTAAIESDSTTGRVGQCKLVAGACPVALCRTAISEGNVSVCLPRFPPAGKPGAKAGCQFADPTEPAADAWDCMDAADKVAVNKVYAGVAKALAAYMTTLASRNSAFDRFVNEGSASSAISSRAKRGARLFVGKAACIHCHSTPLFADDALYNVGVPQLGMQVPTEADCPNGGVCDCINGKNCLPWGGYDGLLKLKAGVWRRDSVYSDSPTDTSRKERLDLEPSPEMKGTWRTPSLRDVALTAPYMHNGIYRTLNEVIWHYNAGGSSYGSAGSKDISIAALRLSEDEVTDLVEFLTTLTGEALPIEVTQPPVLP